MFIKKNTSYLNYYQTNKISIKNVAKYLIYFFISISPAIITVFLINRFFQSSITKFKLIWSDEIFYWHETYSFMHVGFKGGFYSINEIVKNSIVHPGPHGPFYSIFMSLASYLANYKPYLSGPVFNLIFLCCSIMFFLIITKPNINKMIYIFISVIFFWPILLYIPSHMQEVIHLSFAIIISGLFFVLMNGSAAKERINSKAKVALFVILSISSFIRPTWSILFICFFICICKPSIRNFFIALIKGIPLIGFFFIINMSLQSPYPNWLSSLLNISHTSFSKAFVMLLNHFKLNFLRYISLSEGSSLERALHFSVLIIAVFNIIYLFKIVYKLKCNTEIGNNLYRCLFHFNNIFLVLILNLAFYDIYSWRDYRVIAPHLIASILFEILNGDKFLPAVLIFINMSIIPSFINCYKEFHIDHFPTNHSADIDCSVFDKVMSYNENGEPWENTLLVDFSNVDSNLINVPPGIGISLIIDMNTLKSPVKSKYLLINDVTYEALSKNNKLELVNLPKDKNCHGKLYINSNYKHIGN